MASLDAASSSLSADEIEEVLGKKGEHGDALVALADLIKAERSSGVADEVTAENFVELVDSGVRCIDVRSPSEYAKGHIPGAVSVPLFDDEARRLVGTCYKRRGREEAMKLGMNFCLKRGLDALATAALEGEETVCVHCWRGGMRSGAVSWLLRRRGCKVVCLSGGYKAFRGWARARWGDHHIVAKKKKGEEEIPRWPSPPETAQPQIVIVGGRTGVGKTRTLRELERRGEQVLDLEGLARHRGSAFGWMAEQPSNETFENELATRWRRFSLARCVFVEDEEGHVGNCMLPPGLYARMRSARLVVRIDADIDVRVGVLLEEYAHDSSTDGPAFQKRIAEATQRLSKRLGDRTAVVLEHLENGRYDAVARILLGYYDKLYDAHLDKRTGAVARDVVVSSGQPFDAGEAATGVLRETASMDELLFAEPPDNDDDETVVVPTKV